MPLAVAAFAPPSGSLADPPGASVIIAAVSWIEGTLLGTVATTVAVIAVASIGFMMLSGRVSLRHGATVIGGCFLLFGASGIAAGLRSLAPDGGEAPAFAPIPYDPPPPLLPPPRPSAPYDPYAGAAVPAR